MWSGCGGLFAVAFTATAGVRASPPEKQGETEVRAEARFREGSLAFDAGRVDEACAAFEESLHLLLTLGSLLNAALCHERQGKTATAWREFTHAAAWAHDSAQRDRRDFAHQHAMRLERGLSAVRVTLPPGAEIHVEVDGEPLVDERHPLPVFLDPGDHKLVARALDRKPYESTITIAPGGGAAPLVVTVPPLEAESAVVVVPKHVEQEGVSIGARHAAGWALAGIGVAALGVGVYLGADSLSKTGTLASSCANECDPGPARVSEILSISAFGAGAAAVVGGAWLLLTPSTASTALGRPRIVPRVAGHSGGLSVIGSW